MDKNSNATGIIFKISDSKQIDKVLYIFTSEGEKFSLLAKGIRSHTSKRSQSIEMGNLVRIKFVSGYNVAILTDIRVLNEFLHWKQDYKKMIYLQLIFEILNFFSFENNPEPKLYELLLDILSSKSDRVEYLVSILSLRLLNLTGHLPELNRDVETNKEITSSDAILSSNGIGYVKDEGNSGYSVNTVVYKAQRFILENSLADALKLKLSSEDEKKLLNVNLNWVESVIDREIKSRQVIRALNS